MAIICITMLSNPAAFFGAMLPIKPHIITMFALGESYAGHFVCKWGAAPPPTPRFLKAMDACKRKQESSSPASMLAPKIKHQVVAVWIIHVLHLGKLRESFCLQMGGAAPPPTPPLFKGHGCLQKKTNKGQVVASIDACTKQASGRLRVDHSCFALGESFAGHFVCKWGGLRPRPTPPLLKAVNA